MASEIAFGPITLGLVPVSVSNTVIGYLRRRADRRSDRLRRARHAHPHTGHQGGHVHDHSGSIAGQRCRSVADSWCTACRRARGDRTACRWWPAATAATSAGCRRRWARWTACRRSSSTTATRAGRDSPTAAFSRLPHGGARLRRPSRPANARSAAHRACSRRNAVAEMTRWTSWVLFACCDWCCDELERSRVLGIHGDGRPLDGRPRGPAIDGAGSGTPSARRLRSKRSTTRSVSIPDR